MCFHSKQTKKAKHLENRFRSKLDDSLDDNQVSSTHFNGFTFPKTPVITNEKPEVIQLCEWGLIPSWSDENINRIYTLNARIETLDDKPSFKHHHSYRCLVLADGFYEWKWLNKSGTKKEKFHVGIANDAVFAFAGIWSQWISAQTGEIKTSYSIVTTEAQGIMREVHNTMCRMPVILHPEQESLWLEGGSVTPFIDNGMTYLARSTNPFIQQNLF